MIWAAVAAAQSVPVGDVRELQHPAYVHEAGVVFPWRDVRALAAPESRGEVRGRRFGRAALKVVFAGATALEVYGAWKLAEQDSIAAIPLGVQAGFTGLAELLLWSRIPSDRRVDRAIVLDDVNGL